MKKVVVLRYCINYAKLEVEDPWIILVFKNMKSAMAMRTKLASKYVCDFKIEEMLLRE